MDITRRKITKIAREVSRFTAQTFRDSDIGAAEYDLLNLIRQNPGITQIELSRILGCHKSTITRQTASLTKKGYLSSAENEADGRSKLLYATKKADSVKKSRAHTEALFYEWLLDELSEDERAEFALLIDQLYQRCKQESGDDFVHIREIVKNDTTEGEYKHA